jgi:hypothetical protein
LLTSVLQVFVFDISLVVEVKMSVASFSICWRDRRSPVVINFQVEAWGWMKAGLCAFVAEQRSQGMGWHQKEVDKWLQAGTCLPKLEDCAYADKYRFWGGG